MKSRLRTLALTALLVLPAGAFAQKVARSDTSIATLSAKLPAWMDSAGIPGLAVAVLRNGRTEWIGNFGLANVADARPVTDHTLFGAASLSKTVFAYAVLKLVDQGKIDLDAPISRYFADRISADPRLAQVTPRFILSHRSGFPNWRPEGGELRMFFTPGERFSYSGEGMVYLQQAVEHIEHDSLNAIMQRLVFTPLGMRESSYIAQPDQGSRAATGYDNRGRPSLLNAAPHANAAASMTTTAHDYALFLEAVLNRRGLRPVTLRAMETPQVAVDPTCTNCTTRVPKALSTDLFWGLGWGIEQNASGKYLWHWGDNGSFKAFVAADVKRKSAVVMFANSERGLAVARAITNVAIGGAHPSFAWLHYDTYDSHAIQFNRALASRGAAAALGEFSDAIRSGDISEAAVNVAGYGLMGDKRYADAVLLFRRNVEVHPASSNVYDSLGEAYMMAGDTALAIRNYSRSLELDSSNDNARQLLAKLRGAEARSRLPAVVTRADSTRLTEIINATTRYAMLLRDGVPDSTVMLFAEDGQLILPGMNALHGRTAIYNLLAPMAGAIKVSSVDMWVDRAQVAGGTATSAGHYAQLAGPPNGVVKKYTGTYDATWVRGTDGVWRFTQLEMHPDP